MSPEMYCPQFWNGAVLSAPIMLSAGPSADQCSWATNAEVTSCPLHDAGGFSTVDIRARLLRSFVVYFLLVVVALFRKIHISPRL